MMNKTTLVLRRCLLVLAMTGLACGFVVDPEIPPGCSAVWLPAEMKPYPYDFKLVDGHIYVLVQVGDDVPAQVGKNANSIVVRMTEEGGEVELSALFELEWTGYETGAIMPSPHAYFASNGGAYVAAVKPGEGGWQLWRRDSRDTNIYSATLAVAPDGGVFVGGTEFEDSRARSDATLVKLGPAGEVLWTWSNNGPDYDFRVVGLVALDDGGVIALVTYRSVDGRYDRDTDGGDSSDPQKRQWLVRLDSGGREIARRNNSAWKGSAENLIRLRDGTVAVLVLADRSDSVTLETFSLDFDKRGSLYLGGRFTLWPRAYHHGRNIVVSGYFAPLSMAVLNEDASAVEAVYHDIPLNLPQLSSDGKNIIGLVDDDFLVKCPATQYKAR